MLRRRRSRSWDYRNNSHYAGARYRVWHCESAGDVDALIPIAVVTPLAANRKVITSTVQQARMTQPSH